jgi:type II secretory pathway pseudopilin PulG
MRNNTHRRGGINVVELLVIIALVGIMAALILSGLNRQRPSGGNNRRAECLNNLRQIGVAMHNYQAAHGRLPASGTWDVTDPATYSEWSDLDDIANHKARQATMRYSWVVNLLPYVDHSDIYDQWDFGEAKGRFHSALPIGADAKGKSGFGSYWIQSTAKNDIGGNSQLAKLSLKVLTCPADPTTITGLGNLSFVVNANIFTLETSPEYATSFKPPLKTRQRRSLTLNEITDGLAETAMMTENVNVGPGALWETDDLPSNWACPHPWNTSFFANGKFPTVAGVSLAPPLVPSGDGTGINFELTGEHEGRFPFPNSGHKKLVNVLFRDGSAKPINEDMDAETWTRMVSPIGGK